MGETEALVWVVIVVFFSWHKLYESWKLKISKASDIIAYTVFSKQNKISILHTYKLKFSQTGPSCSQYQQLNLFYKSFHIKWQMPAGYKI